MPKRDLEVRSGRDTMRVEKDVELPFRQGVKYLQSCVPGFRTPVAQEDPPLSRQQIRALQKRTGEACDGLLPNIESIQMPYQRGDFRSLVATSQDRDDWYT